jgi:hypothetical protein
MADTKISRAAGATGGPAETVDETTEFLRKDGVYAVPSTVDGVQTLNGGTDTAASAPVLTPAFASGTASQLSDTTRDYMIYLTVTTSGTATTVEFGHSSAADDVVLLSDVSVTAPMVISFRLPAGWYVKLTWTTTVFSQSAVGC